MGVQLSLQWRHNERDDVSNHQPHDCLLNRLFRCRSNKTSKLRVTGLCEGNSPVTVQFPAQRASKTSNFSLWWRHHGLFQLLILVYGAAYEWRLSCAVAHVWPIVLNGSWCDFVWLMGTVYWFCLRFYVLYILFTFDNYSTSQIFLFYWVILLPYSIHVVSSVHYHHNYKIIIIVAHRCHRQI